MEELKGLGFYNLGQSCLILSLLIAMMGFTFPAIILLIFAMIDIIIGFLYWYGIIKKIELKLGKKNAIS